MREIKFRAWDYEHKYWRYGWLTKLTEGVRKFWAIIQDEEDDGLVRYYIHHEKSIGQFTGLHDKNGKEIYEGDIIKWTWLNGNTYVEYVKFDQIYTEQSYGWGYELSGNPEEDGCEIIGNIYENPELLGE